MAAKAEGSSDLLVFEYGGEARSGKGTIVECLAERPGVAKEETGVDYRLLTSVLLERYKNLGDSIKNEEIIARLANMTPDELVAILAEKDDRLSRYGRQSLYEDDVNQLVPDVAQLTQARQAVKAGFARRIEVIRDSREYKAVAIDGRNLSGVIKDIPGVRMALRTFVKCSPVEAALRECARENVDPVSAEGQRKLESIRTRNHKDQNRSEDPMRPDNDALDYWAGSEVEAAASELAQADSTVGYLALIAERLGTFSAASLPQGIGRAAALSSRQIVFDTTVFRLFDDPKGAMLSAAGQMFEEAFSNS